MVNKKRHPEGAAFFRYYIRTNMQLKTHAFRNIFFLRAAAILFTLLVLSSVTQAQDADYDIDPALYQALEWRSAGPHQGGRSATVTGVPNDR